MPTEKKLIAATVNIPSRFSNRNTKASGTYWYCSYCGECPLLKNEHKCIHYWRKDCKYGSTGTVYGFTEKSVKFKKWIDEFREKNKDMLGINERFVSTDKMCDAGDCVYIPINYLFMNKHVNWYGTNLYFMPGYPSIEKDKFTAEFIAREILDFVPRTMMENLPIKNYKTEELPKFMRLLKEYNKELFDEVISLSDDYREKYANMSNVGRIADLNTLEPLVGSFEKEGILWYDGERIKMGSVNVGNLSSSVVASVTVELAGEEPIWVTVTDDAQVNSNTVFKDK